MSGLKVFIFVAVCLSASYGAVPNWKEQMQSFGGNVNIWSSNLHWQQFVFHWFMTNFNKNIPDKLQYLTNCKKIVTTSSSHVVYNAIDHVANELEFYTITTDSTFNVRLSDLPYLPTVESGYFIDICNYSDNNSTRFL